MISAILSRVASSWFPSRQSPSHRRTTKSRRRNAPQVEALESRELLSAGLRSNRAADADADGSEGSGGVPALRANQDSPIILYRQTWTVTTDASCCNFGSGVTFTQTGTTVTGAFTGGTLTGKIIKGRADENSIAGLGLAGKVTFNATDFGPKSGTFSATLDLQPLMSFTGILKIKGGNRDHTFNGMAPGTYFDSTDATFQLTINAGRTRVRADQTVAILASVTNLGTTPIPGNRIHLVATVILPLGTNFLGLVQSSGLKDCVSGVNVDTIFATCQLGAMISSKPAIAVLAVDFSALTPGLVEIELTVGSLSSSTPFAEPHRVVTVITLLPPRNA